MVFGTTFSSQNLISETNKGKLILKIDEDFYQFIKDPSNYGEINVDGSQNIKIYPGLGITDICAIDLFIANRSSNMFSDNSRNCLERDLSDIDFISYKCLSENTIYDISLDNSFVEITIEYKPNRLNKLNEILTNDASVNRNSSKLKFFNSPKIFNNALKRDDYSKHLIMPELNDEYNIPGRDLSGHFNNLIYYKSSNYEGDISTSLYIHDISAEILTPVQLLNYKLLEIQKDASKNVFFNTYNWGDYTHPLSGFHLGALAYNNLLYNDLSYDSNEFYNNSGIYIDEQTYRKLTIPHMANKYIKRINDISLSVNWYQDISLEQLSTASHNYKYPDMSLVYNSDFNELEKGTSLTNKDKNLLFNIDNSWQYICDVCFTDISLYSQTSNDISDVSYIYHEIKDNFFNIFNEDGEPSKLIKLEDGSDFSCIKTKLGLPEDSIGRDCEIKIEYYYEQDNGDQRKVNYFFKGYDLSSCFGFFNSEYNKMFGQESISGTMYDISYLYKTGGDILSEPGLMECTTSLNIDLCNQIHNPDNYDLCGGKINYKKKYGYTFSNFNNTITLSDNQDKEVINFGANNGIWSFYTNNTRYSYFTGARGHNYISHSILWKKVMDAYHKNGSASDLKIKDILHSSYIKYLKFMDKNFFSFNEWAKLERGHINHNDNYNSNYVDYLFRDKNSSITSRMDVSNISIDDIFEEKGFLSVVVLPSDNNYPSGAITNHSARPWYNETHSINGVTNTIAYHSIDDYINDISLLIQSINLPIFNNNSPITKYISGSINDFFRYIEFINRRLKLNGHEEGIEWYKITSQSNYKHDYINVFPFLVLHYNYNATLKLYQLGVTTENYYIEEHKQGTIGGVVPSKKLKVYARKARQDINTKKLLDIKEFDKIPLFLYKDPFVNNHHQFEITSETIPTIYPALTCDISATIVETPEYTAFHNPPIMALEFDPPQAIFENPQGIAISPDNSFALVSDTTNMRIAMIDLSSKIVTNFAGIYENQGVEDVYGDSARFWNPAGIAISPDNSFALVADIMNHRIRKIVIATRQVTTFAGMDGHDNPFDHPHGIAISPDNSFALVADTYNNRIVKINLSDNSVFVYVNGFNKPYDVAISPDNSFALVADHDNAQIRKIDLSDNSVSILAGLAGVHGHSDGSGINARFTNTKSVDITPDGLFAFVTDWDNGMVRAIDISTGYVTTITPDMRPVYFYNLAISPDGTFALVSSNYSNSNFSNIYVITFKQNNRNIINKQIIYNKKSLEEIYLSVDFTNSTNNLNNRFLSNFKTQLNKNNELFYFAQQNKNNPPIKFKIRNSNYDDFSYNFETDNSYSIVNGQYNNYINDLFSYNLPRFQYRPIYESINTNILTILNCNNNPDFSTNFGNKHFENLLAINNNKLPKLNEEKYTYKLFDYSDNNIYNLNKIYEYRVNDLSSYSYFADISLNDDINIKINVLEAFNDICTNYYDMNLINYMNNKNSEKIDNFPLYQNISIKIDRTDYTSIITDGSNYKLDLQLWDVSNMFIDVSNKYQIDFSNINCKGLNIFGLIEDISINNDWDYIYSEKLLRSRDFSFSGSALMTDLSFSINITDLSGSNLSITNLNYLDLSYNLYDASLNSSISNKSMSNRVGLNFNYLTSRDNSENLNYYLNNVKNLNIIDNPDRNLLENYNNNDFNNFNMKMFDFETLHPKIHSNIINDNSKIDICPEAFLNCDLFFENNFNLYDESYNYYKINNTKDTNYLDMSNSRLNISELFEYKMFSSSNLIQDISKSIETFNFTPFTKNFINDISFYFSDNINYIYSNKYSPLNINAKNDLIPNVNLIDNNNKVVYKNTILLPKDASNLFADLNFDKINSLMNFTKTDNCDKMFKNTLSLYDNRLLKFSAFNNLNNDILLNEMFMNSSINFFPYLLINSLKNCSNSSKIEAQDIITNCNNIYLNEYFLAIKSFSEVLDFNNNLKYTNNDLSNVEISWNLTNNKYFGSSYPSTFEQTIKYNINDQQTSIKIDKIFIESLDSEKGIYWDYYLSTGVNYEHANIIYNNKFNCINKLDVNNIPNHGNIRNDIATHRLHISSDWQGSIITGDFSLNIYKTREYERFHYLSNKELYWSIGFLLKILGFTDLSNQTHYNKPISLNSKYEQRRKFLKEKMYKHNNTDQILDWYGVDDRYCGQFDDTSMSSYINYDYSLNVINLFYLFPETSYCWLDLSINLSYRDIYYEDHFVNKIVKPNKTLDIMKNDPFYRYDTAYDYASKVMLSNDFFYLSWLEKYAINTLNKGLNYNDSPVFRYIYINSFATEMLNNENSLNNDIPTHISDIMINVKLNNSDQSFVLIDNSICELFNIFNLNDNFLDSSYQEMWFQDGSGIYTSLGNTFDNCNNTINSKKFPFYHYTNEDIAGNSSVLNNFRVSKLCPSKQHEYNANFWIKIDLGFILNKLYPHEFKSKTIPLNKINYMYFFEGYTYDNWNTQITETQLTETTNNNLIEGNYSKKSTNLTYILSNINYSSFLEHDINDPNNFYDMSMSLLKPGYLNKAPGIVTTLDVSGVNQFYNPRAIDISRDNDFALVSVYIGGEYYIYKINLSNNTVTDSYLMNGEPSDVAIAPNNLYALVTTIGIGGQLVKKIHFSNNLIESIGNFFQNPQGVAIAPNGNFALVIDKNGTGVQHIHRITLPNHDINYNYVPAYVFDSRGITITSDSLYAIVCEWSGGGRLLKINIATGNHVKIANLIEPISVTLTPDNSFAFVIASGVSVWNNTRNVINAVDMSTGVVTTIAGQPGIGNADGNGTGARFEYPTDVAISISGNFALVADNGNHAIRMITNITNINDINNTYSFGKSSDNFNNYNYTDIIDHKTLLSYNYKVINSNECNLFSYINGFPKDLNTASSGNYQALFTVISDNTNLDLSVRRSDISKNTKIGILIKGNTDFNDEIIYTEISNNIAPQNNLKHNQSDNRIFNNYSHILSNTMIFDYLPYQNREQYETREIRNYFIENYSNISKIE